jgi:transposase
MQRTKLKIDKPWTKADIRNLIRMYPDIPNAVIGKKLGRTPGAILMRGFMLGLRKNRFDTTKKRVFKNKRLWSKEEIQMLIELYPTMTSNKIAEKIGRSPASVKFRARVHRLKKNPSSWSKEQIDFVKKFYREMTYAQVAEKLGKKKHCIAALIRRLKLRRKMPARWTEKEIKFLRENYPNHTNLWLADKLKRSTSAVSMLGFQFGIAKTPELISRLRRAIDLCQNLKF